MSDELRYLIADAWVGWLRPVLLLVAVGVLALTYVLDWLAEPAYARLLSGVAAAVAGLGPAVAGAILSRSRLGSALALALGLVWAAAYVAPTWRLVTPGEPAAVQTIAAGEDLRLAAAPDGGATLLVAADALLAGDAKGDGTVHYRLKVTDDAGHDVTVEGELSRRTVGGTRGSLPDPNSKRTIVHAANLHSVPWPAGQPLRVHATTITPKSSGALTVTVLPWTFPWLPVALALILALGFAVIADARFVSTVERSFLPHAGGVALAFLLLVRDGIAPVGPVKPLFGTLLLALILGALGGAALSFVGRKVLGGKALGAKEIRGKGLGA